MSELTTRRDKVVALKQWMDLEKGTLRIAAFEKEIALYHKARELKKLRQEISECRKCPNLNVAAITEGCGGYGDPNASIFIVGQSLHKPGMRSHIPFVAEDERSSGLLVVMALWLSGLNRRDCYWSNVVKCHPEGNRGSLDDEKLNCMRYLGEEINIVRPKLLVALGQDARDYCAGHRRSLHLMDVKQLYVKHPANIQRKGDPDGVKNWCIKLSSEIDRVIHK